MFAIETAFLEHDGGTKFYEVISITDKQDGETILIKRWGKMNVANACGGGQMLFETFASPKEASAEAVSVVREKTTPRKGKGVYRLATMPPGINRSSGKTVSDTDLVSLTGQHYGPYSAAYNAIWNLFGQVLTSEDDVIEESMDIEEPADKAKPEQLKHRDETWGTW